MNRNIFIIQVPIQIVLLKTVLGNYLGNAKITTYNMSSSELIDYEIDENSVSNKRFRSKRFMVLLGILFKSFFHRIEDIYICDLGAINKIFICFVNAKNVYILDDGLASILRKERDYKLISGLSRFVFITSEKKIAYKSIYKKAWVSQPGTFNMLSKNEIVSSTETFRNTLFFLSPHLIMDGMSEDQEDLLIEKLQKFSLNNAMELRILPHRKDRVKYKKNYKYHGQILENKVCFEEFYLRSNFVGCKFITLYSGAVCCISDDHQRYFIKDYFVPVIERTFFNRLFLIPIWSIDLLYKYFEEINICELRSADINIE